MSETTYIEIGWLENEQNEVNLAQEKRLDMVLCDVAHANAQGYFYHTGKCNRHADKKPILNPLEVVP